MIVDISAGELNLLTGLLTKEVNDDKAALQANPKDDYLQESIPKHVELIRKLGAIVDSRERGVIIVSRQ